MNQSFIAPAFLRANSPKRARHLRRGLLLSGATGVALSMGTFPAFAQSKTSAAVPAVSNLVATSASNRARAPKAGGSSVALVAVGLRQALALAPDDVSAARELARFYTRQNRLEEAAATWKRVAVLKSGDAEAARELARVSSRAPLATHVASPATNAAPLATETTGNALADVAPLPMVIVPRLQTRAVAQTASRGASRRLAPAPVAKTRELSDIGPLGALSVSDEFLLAQNAEAANGSTSGPMMMPNAPAAPEPEAPTPETSSPETSSPAPVSSARPHAARPISKTLSPIPFELPASRIVSVSKKRVAAAWPHVNLGAKFLNVSPKAAQSVRMSRIRQALAEYQRAEELNPANIYASSGVATAQLILGNYDESVAASLRFLSIVSMPGVKKKASERKAENDMVAKSLRELANALTYSRRYREAVGVNDFILAGAPDAIAPEYRSALDTIEAEYQNGKIFTYAGAYTSANAAFSRAYGLDNTRADILADWGLALSYAKNRSSIAVLTQGLKMQPGNFRLTLARGAAHYYFNQFKEAVPDLRAILSVQPDNMTALVYLADCLAFDKPSNKVLNQAIGYYRRALVLQPTNEQAKLGLGRALVFAGQFTEGGRRLNSFLTLHPNNVPALEALAVAQVLSDSPKAGNTYETLLRLQSEPKARARTLASIGDFRLTRNDLAGATQKYAQARNLDRNNPTISLVYAQLLSYSNDRWPETAVAAQRALALAPNNPQALAVALQAAVRTEDNATTARLAQKLRGIQPKTAEESLVLAQALRDVNFGDESDRLLTLAAAQVKDDDKGRATLLRLADATRDAVRPVFTPAGTTTQYGTAISLYQRLLRKDPRNAKALLGLTTALLYSRNYTAAQAQVPALQAVENTLPVAERHRAFYIEASVQLGFDTTESRQNAVFLANKVLKEDASNAEARTIVGRVYATLGQFGEASQQFVVAVDNPDTDKRSPTYAEALTGLAQTLYAARDVPGAVARYRQLIALAPNDTGPKFILAQILLDTGNYAEAEQLYNDVITLQRQSGRPVLSSVRRAIASNSLVSLSPLAQLQLPVTRGLALLKPRANNRRVVVNNPGASVNSRRRLFAQNPTVSAPASPIEGASGAGVMAPASPPTGDFSQTAPSPNDPVTIPLPGANTGTGAATAPPLPGAPAAPDAPVVDENPDPNAPPFDPRPLPPFDSPLTPGVEFARQAYSGLGESRLRQNQPADALGFFNQAIALPGGTNDPVARAGRARAYRALGQFVPALEDANTATDPTTGDPNNIGYQVLRGQLLADTGQTEAAKQVFTAQEERLQTNPTLATTESYLQLAFGYNTVGNHTAALNLVDTLLKTNANDPSLLRLRAETLGLSGQTDESLKAYDVAIAAADPKDDTARLGKARVLNYANRLTEAEAVYQEVLNLNPNNVIAQREIADVFTRDNKFTEAAAFYTQAIAASPNDFSLVVAQARLQRVSGKTADAEAALTALLDAHPDDIKPPVEGGAITSVNPGLVDALIERGSIRGSIGNYGPALADLDLARKLNPNSPAALLALAQVQSYSGDYNNSITSYNTFLANNPTNPNLLQARVELAQTLGYANRGDEALAEVETVLGQTTDPVVKNTALITRAGIFARTDRTGDAVTIYNDLLTADPNNAQAQIGLADAYLYGRQYDKAIPAYQKIADSNSPNAPAARAGLGDALLYDRQYPKAIALYDRIIAANPDNTAAKISRARALSYAGRSKEAVAALRPVVDADKTNIPARVALAEAGANSGNAQLQRDAITQYRAILADPNNNANPQLILNTQLGLARVLSYRGQTAEAEQILNSILAANPANQDARLALADTQRFAGNSFEANKNYQLVRTTGGLTPAQTTSLNAGIGNLNRATSPSVGASYSHYDDTNGIRLNSVGENAIFRTRAFTLGVLANQGRFRQGQLARRNRNEIGILLARQFGPISARLVVSQLKYSGVSNKTLFSLGLNRDFSTRRRINLSYSRRDIFETDLAVGRGITADIANLTGSIPLGKRFDFDLSATHYDYSDNNTRLTLSPALMFRLKGKNPTLRVGLGYTYDNADQRRDAPFVYYTPQNFNAASILADYIVTSGRTRYGISGGIPLTTSTGDNNTDRPADTLFGFLERDLGDNLSFNVRGGIVRVPNGAYRSNQISGGLDYSF